MVALADVLRGWCSHLGARGPLGSRLRGNGVVGCGNGVVGGGRPSVLGECHALMVALADVLRGWCSYWVRVWAAGFPPTREWRGGMREWRGGRGSTVCTGGVSCANGGFG